jgi:hypothetical protein
VTTPRVEKDDAFESWAFVELFGHMRIAGKVSESTIGGCSFVRLDVPATTGKPGYTRYLGNGAIYSITPCSEEYARLAAHTIERYRDPIPVDIPKQLAAHTGGSEEDATWDSLAGDDDDDDDEDRLP